MKTRQITRSARVRVKDGSDAVIVIRPERECRIELDIGEDCSVSSYTICAGRAEVLQKSRLGARSRLDSFSIWLGGGRRACSSRLCGVGASAHDILVFIGKGSSRLSADSELVHAARDTSGDILVKGVVKGSARADLGGMIRVMKEGEGAESFLSEHALLLGSGARATADPKLEIMNNDVMSRHSASVSQISEGKLFYLMSRGLPRADAESLIVSGFLDSAISRMGSASFRKQFGRLAAKGL